MTDNNSLQAAIGSYIDYYAASSSHTAKAKKLDVNKFIRFLTKFHGYSKPEKLKLKDWTHASTKRFIDDCLHQEKPATVARRLATLKHCSRKLAEQINGFKNPTLDIKTPTLPNTLPKSISAKEIKEVMRIARSRLNQKDSFNRYRNLVIFQFLLETGLRADEIRLLRISQIDDELEWITNVRTKGNKFRNVYINSDLSEKLSDYLERRASHLKKSFTSLNPQTDAKLPVFISTYKSDISEPDSFLMGSKTLWRAINELSAEVKLHPHLLRHTFAHDLLDSAKDIRLVSQALGHGDVRITMKYTERSDAEVAAAIEKKKIDSKKTKVNK